MLHNKRWGENKNKTKTAHIVALIQDENYQRVTAEELLKCNKKEAKTILIARFGMLACGKNYQGSNSTVCSECHVIDDETHRLNHCIKFREINFVSVNTNIDFQLVYSRDVNVLKDLAVNLSNVWNTRNANGTMNQY